jgi:hypothetical protein
MVQLVMPTVVCTGWQLGKWTIQVWPTKRRRRKPISCCGRCRRRRAVGERKCLTRILLRGLCCESSKNPSISIGPSYYGLTFTSSTKTLSPSGEQILPHDKMHLGRKDSLPLMRKEPVNAVLSTSTPYDLSSMTVPTTTPTQPYVALGKRCMTRYS